ncbi:tetratricopeptide repeat protein [Thermodesulfatator autotrophicus]|uniref:Alkyl hydroperoxide reductase subunit C/ Thiol specific antioxidant domain-containing protein n=1 Tax=Thermodesulfatator autotrophicus TaxID=1795632 RepID=A0A177E5A6_9BACT|nr:tetratricopeptide repeat protein [Thermodesulfatator autotrophicus]OAG26681.1 hypothetical protein TH606_11040 [Thermodesulfatator autotrophicus]
MSRLFKLGLILLIIFKGFPSNKSWSFPYRNIKKDTTIPNFCVYTLEDNKFCIESLKGYISVILFWGADSDIKEKRSIKVLQSFKNYYKDWEQKKIKLVAINTQKDPIDKIKKIIKENELEFPVFIDKDQDAYQKLGIYILPSVLILDKNSKIIDGIGYTKNLAQKTNIVLLALTGDKKHTQKPKKQKPENQRKAERHLNFAITLIKRGLEERAITEIKKALKIYPNYYKARIILGCLYYKKGKLELATKELEESLKHEKSTKGVICLAKIKAEQGKLEEAITELKRISITNNPDVLFLLGNIYEKKGEIAKAATYYRKAYEKIKKQSNENIF